MLSLVFNLVAITALGIGWQNTATQKPEMTTKQNPNTGAKKLREQKQKPTKNSTKKTEQPENSEDALSENQKRALYRLRNLQREIRAIDDPEWRVKLQVQVADTLWLFDPIIARQQFKDAFDEIGTFKEFRDKLVSVNVGKNENASSKGINAIKFELRNYIISILSQRDPDLADSLISSQKKAEQLSDERMAEEISKQRLAIAKVIARSNPEKAIAISIDEIRKNLSEDSIGALFAVRLHHQEVADAAFSGILSWVESNKSLYSHNALGVLGSYILVGEDAANLNYNGHIKPQIFEQYLRFAYKVIEYNIQNNLSPQEKEINQSYWAMQNLLPLYEKYLPTELPKLRSHINELGNRVTQKTKDAILASRPNDSSSVDDLLRLADESTNPRKKDGLIVRAAMLAARQGDYEQAVFIMEKVDNLGIRNNMISTIYFQAGKKAVALKNTDLALQLARKIVHIHSQRWNLYFDVINVVANENKGRAIELLGEIEAYVKSMRDDAPERALGLFEIANVAGKIDVSRARTVARLAIRSLNSADFDKPQTEGIARITRDRFVFASLWTYFAHVDFDEAILLTGLIEYKPILVSSQILICKALLSENYKQQ